MSEAAIWDVKIEGGSDFRMSVSYLDSACSTIDITGYGAALDIIDPEDEFVLHRADTQGNAYIVVNTSALKFDITIPAASTAAPNRTWTKGEYDLIIWPTAASSDVNPVRLLKGKARYEEIHTTP